MSSLLHAFIFLFYVVQNLFCGEAGGDVAERGRLHAEILLGRGGGGREGGGGGGGRGGGGGGGRGGRRQWRTSPALRGRRAEQRVEIQSPFQRGSARHGRGGSRGAWLGRGRGRVAEPERRSREPTGRRGAEKTDAAADSVRGGGGGRRPARAGAGGRRRPRTPTASGAGALLPPARAPLPRERLRPHPPAERAWRRVRGGFGVETRSLRKSAAAPWTVRLGRSYQDAPIGSAASERRPMRWACEGGGDGRSCRKTRPVASPSKIRLFHPPPASIWRQ